MIKNILVCAILLVSGVRAESAVLPNSESDVSLPLANVSVAKLPSGWEDTSRLLKEISAGIPSGSLSRVQAASVVVERVSPRCSELFKIAKANRGDESLMLFMSDGLLKIGRDSGISKFVRTAVLVRAAEIAVAAGNEKLSCMVLTELVRGMISFNDLQAAYSCLDAACSIARVSGKAVRTETAHALVSAMKHNPYNRVFAAYVVLAAKDLLK